MPATASCCPTHPTTAVTSRLPDRTPDSIRIRKVGGPSAVKGVSIGDVSMQNCKDARPSRTVKVCLISAD